jgi:quinol monooxygenase YgiN
MLLLFSRSRKTFLVKQFASDSAEVAPLKSVNRRKEINMVKLALLARMEAKPGKEENVAEFLREALPLAEKEPGTTSWFAFRIGSSIFGIFDTFNDEAGRQAHLSGPIAAALMAKASELLAKPPVIEKLDLLAGKTKD